MDRNYDRILSKEELVEKVTIFVLAGSIQYEPTLIWSMVNGSVPSPSNILNTDLRLFLLNIFLRLIVAS
jgi:hypothetical protein